MKLYLIRHAESEANAKGILQGQKIDVPLSERGKEQAKKLAKRLKSEKIEAIHSSDMKRAIETAKEIAKEHNLKIISDKRLIKTFNKIRDEPLDVIKNRCWEKHKKLKKEFEKLGYKVRYQICSFKWSNQKLPEEILKIPHKDLDYHLYLKIRIYGKWIDVDASNDSQFPEYNSWDGLIDCDLAVNPKEVLMFKESDKILEKIKDNKDIIEDNKKFLEEVNKFFDKIKKKDR